MAIIAHKNLTDPEIHEPKGISTALANTTYVTNGLGSGTWQELQTVDPGLVVVPIGIMVDFAGVNAPEGWLLCYGQEISRITYANLFAALGTTFGAGDGSTTFLLPDCRGRTIAGKDNMGGVSASRLINTVSGGTLGAVGGVEQHTLIASEVPVLTGTTSTDGEHNHTLGNATAVYRVSSSGTMRRTSAGGSPDSGVTVSLASTGAHTHAVTVNAGGGDPHSNLQPMIVFNTIIYAGV